VNWHSHVGECYHSGLTRRRTLRLPR
jgi:hypothetical protein